MPQVWFTSDLHLNHDKVAGFRGFRNSEEHDFWLSRLWDEVVAEMDHVWVLGDVHMSRPQDALDWVHDRPGYKHLIAGNHDEVFPGRREAYRRQRAWWDVFTSIQGSATRKVLGQPVLLSHFPYWSDGDGPGREGARYEQWRLPDLGLPLLHGHTHTDIKAYGRSLHVGIDAWKELVPLAEIEKWISEL